jgi:hypothetical protein
VEIFRAVPAGSEIKLSERIAETRELDPKIKRGEQPNQIDIRSRPYALNRAKLQEKCGLPRTIGRRRGQQIPNANELKASSRGCAAGGVHRRLSLSAAEALP